MGLVSDIEPLRGPISRAYSAFGGMIAFCIIVGDTIPTVFRALFPKLHELPFLWLLTNRRAVIVLLILGVSYPLSLYRDIAKVIDFPLLVSSYDCLRSSACKSFWAGPCLYVYNHNYHCNSRGTGASGISRLFERLPVR